MLQADRVNGFAVAADDKRHETMILLCPQEYVRLTSTKHIALHIGTTRSKSSGNLSIEHTLSSYHRSGALALSSSYIEEIGTHWEFWRRQRYARKTEIAEIDGKPKQGE